MHNREYEKKRNGLIHFAVAEANDGACSKPHREEGEAFERFTARYEMWADWWNGIYHRAMSRLAREHGLC